MTAGYDPFLPAGLTPKLELLNRLKADGPRVWDDEPFDAIPFYTAVEYLKEKKPRVLYLSLGETDDWAHGGRYREYLDSAHRVDAYVKALWDLAQSLPEYRATPPSFSCPTTDAERPRTNGKTTAKKFRTLNIFG